MPTHPCPSRRHAPKPAVRTPRRPRQSADGDALARIEQLWLARLDHASAGGLPAG
ncbi:MAG: hypothetical protein J0M02_02670 [Planctomycetes bacterium]|nr:hypothetical protein [Planctomycetota bacterium]